ncbi:MAG: heparan-alpha-glucosaminide N-acetyltransferase domain-containing protein [Chitinophagaceae bacterium]
MASQSPRFLATDVLRGMTVCFMIIVNTAGNGDTTWAPLKHASWNGFTPTDLVFPTFMFVVGNALFFAEKKWQGLADGTVFRKILKRTVIIFLLGYLMYWFPFVHWNDQGGLEMNPIANTRIMGVLQRIALGYFFGALLIRYGKEKNAVRAAASFLVIYWLLLLFFSSDNDPYGMLTNAGTRLDLWLFGENHLYHGEGVAFDPEGLLSTLPSIANVVFGYAAGKWIVEKGKTWEGLAKLLLTGASLVALALLWHTVFPINKKLWTGSFVLLTAGIDCILLSALAYVIDFRQKTKWTWFFQVPGKNPLFVYLLSELGATLLWFFHTGENKQPLYSWIYQHIFQPAGDYAGSFLFAVSFMLCCWGVGYFLDKKKIYIRV